MTPEPVLANDLLKTRARGAQDPPFPQAAVCFALR